MRIAYVTSDACGSGHAVRGIALVEAAERLAPPSCRALEHVHLGPGGGHLGLGLDETPAQGISPRVAPLLPLGGGQFGPGGGEPLPKGFPPFIHATNDTLTLRAFGPPVLTSVDLTGYEGSADWRIDVLKWQPDLLIGDLRPEPLETIRLQLGVPAWLLVRIWPREWRGAPSWERVVAIEPGAETLPFLTDRIPPIVGRQRVWPEPGTEMQAGYNAFWEASLYGYRVTWAADRPERRTRIEVGGSVSENGADVLVRQAASTA